MLLKTNKRFESYLSEFVYGGIDGAVTTFAVVAGSTGAGFDNKILLVLGFANLIADGFSMGVGSYLSTKSEQQLAHKRGEAVVDAPSPFVNGAATYASFLLVGLVPLLAYVVDAFSGGAGGNLFFAASVLTALAFIGIGVLKSRIARTSVVRGVAETLILGVIAALVAYFVGGVLERIIT